MLNIPALRWGEPYSSLETDEVVHFATGEPLAKVSQANGGLVKRDMRKAQRARDVLREIPVPDLIAMAGKAGDLYMNAELPLGDGTQTPAEFARMQSATTGLPEHMCRGNMKKNHFVLNNMEKILTSLTRNLDLNICRFGDQAFEGPLFILLTIKFFQNLLEVPNVIKLFQSAFEIFTIKKLVCPSPLYFTETPPDWKKHALVR